MRRLLLAVLLLSALGAQAQAGPIGLRLGKYSIAGAGIGTLLGAVTATMPYLQSKEPYDFLAGAGIGMLAGAGTGLILGVVDVANDPPKAALAHPDGLWLALQPRGATLGFNTSF